MMNLIFSISYHHAQAMKSCEVDLSESDVARLVLRFDEDESMRIDIKNFIKFIRGRVCTDSVLCYIVLCYVMLYCVMLCYVMLCYVMLCYVMLCYVMS